MNASFHAHAFRILLLLLIKTALFVLLVRDAYMIDHIGRWSIRDGDTWEYVDPAESLLAGGDYAPDHRMPGYSAVWLVLRSLLSYADTADALGILHVLFGSLAIYAFVWTLYRSTGSARVFWLALLLLGYSTYAARYDTQTLNESFTTSVLLLYWTFFVRWRRDRRWYWLVLSGAMIGWATFMRPIYTPLLALVPLFLLFDQRQVFARRVALSALFLVPFLLADIPWALRNYRHHHVFHPLTNGIYGPTFSVSPYYAGIKMLQSYGGNYNFWDPTSDLRWFGFRERPRNGIAALKNDYPPPPAYALIPGYPLDSLERFGQLMMDGKDETRTPAEREASAAAAHRWADRYRAAYAEARPFQYQVMSRLRMLRHLLVQSGTASLLCTSWQNTPWPKKVFKLSQSALYVFAMVCGGVLALVLLFRGGTAPEWRALMVLVLYGIFSHPFLMRICDVRYLAPTFPLTLAVGVLLVCSIRRKRVDLSWARTVAPNRAS